jgi:orotidine-5'-phosphate decarboxylase
MAAMPTFADCLQQKIREHSPLCVGIDPSAALLKACGLPDSAEGALEFGQRVLEAADFRVAVLKPQSAFFERFGSAGFRALEALVQLARAREVLVLLDGKRGDIDTTAAAYAEGYFSATTTLRVDAITTHCYLGLAALEPFFAAAIAAEGGVFVVVRSSNPEGQGLQTARMANGETVAQSLCREITARNLRQRKEGLGPIGAVVGATCDDANETVAAMPHSFVLAPGVGAQGATMRDVLARMPAGRGRVLPNVSRAILGNGSRREDIRTTIAVMQDQARELL